MDIKSFFDKLCDLTLPKIYIPIVSWIKKRHQKELLLFIKDLICAHQGRLIEYNALGKERRDQLRKAVEAFQEGEKLNNAGNSDGALLVEVEERLLELDGYLFSRLDKICYLCFQQLNDFYKQILRRNTYPRMSVKIIGPTPGSVGDNFVMTLAHSKRHEGIRSSRTLKENNTAFLRTGLSGEAFICNNIPQACEDDEYPYINPRLDMDSVQKYLSPSITSRAKRLWWRLTGQSDKDWATCWKPYNEGAPVKPSDCYKSTLVAPMTLRGQNDLDDEFWKCYAKHIISSWSSQGAPSSYGLEDAKKTIIGYFCLDAPSPDFFDEEIDEWLGWLIADIISLYWHSAFCYTSASIVYKQAKKIVEPN